MDCELNSLTELETAEKAISSAGSANHQGNSSNQKNHNKRCHPKIKGYFQTFLSCFLLLAIIGLIVVIILHSTKLNGRIQLLESQIERIEASLGNNDSTSAVAAVLQAQQMALHLEASLTSLNASLVTMGTHGQQLSAMVASNISELRHHLQDLEATLVNSSLRQRFTGCYEDRQLCTILPVEEDLFFRGCRTHTIPANISGYYTLNMRCEVRTNLDGVLKSSQLEALGQNVRCVCGFVHMAANTPAAHGPLHRGLTAQCTIAVTRCPS